MNGYQRPVLCATQLCGHQSPAGSRCGPLLCSFPEDYGVCHEAVFGRSATWGRIRQSAHPMRHVREVRTAARAAGDHQAECANPQKGPEHGWKSPCRTTLVARGQIEQVFSPFGE
jgi:hypothetical protein